MSEWMSSGLDLSQDSRIELQKRYEEEQRRKREEEKARQLQIARQKEKDHINSLLNYIDKKITEVHDIEDRHKALELGGDFQYEDEGHAIRTSLEKILDKVDSSTPDWLKSETEEVAKRLQKWTTEIDDYSRGLDDEFSSEMKKSYSINISDVFREMSQSFAKDEMLSEVIPVEKNEASVGDNIDSAIDELYDFIANSTNEDIVEQANELVSIIIGQGHLDDVSALTIERLRLEFDHEKNLALENKKKEKVKQIVEEVLMDMGYPVYGRNREINETLFETPEENVFFSAGYHEINGENSVLMSVSRFEDARYNAVQRVQNKVCDRSFVKDVTERCKKKGLILCSEQITDVPSNLIQIKDPDDYKREEQTNRQGAESSQSGQKVKMLQK